MRDLRLLVHFTRNHHRLLVRFPTRRRRLFVPEVVQTSALDCGPACLSALLGGFGLYASYGRLREACQTGVDGTCIDTIEELANRLGLEAEQIILPADHLALPEAAALPAMAVVKLPTGFMHFVIVWNRHGRRLQLMDPVTGRRWTPIDEFLKELHIHEMTVPAARWREWAQSEEFRAALKARMTALGMTPDEASGVIKRALAQPSWRPVATVDATVRMLDSLARSGGFTKDFWPHGSQPCRSRPYRLLTATMKRALEKPRDVHQLIPREYWSVQPNGEEDQLVVRGAVLVRVKGRGTAAVHPEDLPPEIAAAVSEPPPRPVAELWRLLKREGAFGPTIIGAAFFVSAIGVVVQALLFRALIEGGREFSAQGQRLGAVTAVLALLVILLAIDIPAVAMLVGMGRRLEARFRAAFLTKLPRIAEHYFHSRLTSDMAERSHSVHNLRTLPGLAGQLLRSVFDLILTTSAVIWIDPALWPLAIVSAVVAVGLPIAVQPWLGERELRVRTHAGALSRFYFDALLGLIPIRTHVADGVVRGEHRGLLAQWAAASLATQRLAIALEGIQLVAGFGLAALLAINHISRHPESSALLLLAYWGLNIPVIGRDLASLACQYPQHRNTVLRLLEPLGALENQYAEPLGSSQPATERGRAVAITMERVSVMAAGHTILRDIEVDIPAGNHVAIIGPSGAGKSSLVGLLLGWRAPASGTLLVDHQPLSAPALERLRRQTAWIDPTVQLWNRSLIENLRYGLIGEPSTSVGKAVDEVQLASVLEKLPDGLQTGLGDSGALLSGGEGQRVRVGRGILRPGVRLAIMDEPFRGLDASARKNLLRCARRIWRDATILFVTHDVSDTQAFDQVFIMEAGTIVEHGAPAELAKCPDSRYNALLRLEAELKRHLLEGAQWRRLEIENGVLSEKLQPGALPKGDAATPALRIGTSRSREMIA